MRYLVFILTLIPAYLFAHPGVGIVEDHRGNIYYTDLVHVWRISSDGVRSIAVRNVHTHELFIDESDNLYGEHLWYNGEKSNTWSHFVWKLSSQGKFDKIIPDTYGFLTDYSFVRDHAGRMYWADRSTACQKVVKRNVDKTPVNLSDQCFENIRFMKSSKKGEVFLIDFQDLKKIDLRGNVRTIATRIADKNVFSSTVANQNSVMGVWDDKNGNIYTAIFSARVIKKFSSAGNETIVFTSSSPWSPSGGLVDSRGCLWILECSSTSQVRVQKVRPDGTKTIY